MIINIRKNMKISLRQLQKVSTLSQSHQNYLNKQIDKVNNKIEKTEKR